MDKNGNRNAVHEILVDSNQTNILKEANGGFEEVQDNNCCGNLELNISGAFNGKP